MAGATTWPSRKTAFSTEANSGSARRASATLNEGSGFHFAPSLTLRALLQSLQLSAPKADARLSTPSKEVILVWRHGMDEADGWISRQDWRRGWPCRISRESRHYASL